MSVDNAKKFYLKITTDEAFRTQLQNTASEERTTIIQAAGYEFTPEEWEVAAAQILENANRELDDAELEAVAGGTPIFLGPSMHMAYGVPPLQPDLNSLQPDLNFLLEGPSIPPSP